MTDFSDPFEAIEEAFDSSLAPASEGVESPFVDVTDAIEDMFGGSAAQTSANEGFAIYDDPGLDDNPSPDLNPQPLPPGGELIPDLNPQPLPPGGELIPDLNPQPLPPDDGGQPIDMGNPSADDVTYIEQPAYGDDLV